MTPLVLVFLIFMGVLVITISGISCYELWCISLNRKPNSIATKVFDIASLIFITIIAVMFIIFVVSVLVALVISFFGV